MEELHAAKRAYERYGLTLTEHDLRDISARTEKEGILQARQADGSAVWLMKILGVVCRIVLSRSKTVVTFLPANGKTSKARV